MYGADAVCSHFLTIYQSQPQTEQISNSKSDNRMYQTGVISGFGGFEKGLNYEDSLTRKKFCEEPEKCISTQHENCILTLKMNPRDVFIFLTDVLYAEAKKKFCISIFSRTSL